MTTLSIDRTALDAAALVAAFAAAIGIAGAVVERSAPTAAPRPLPTALPRAVRYFDPVPTPAPTRAGLQRRFTPAGLEGGLSHEVLARLPDPNASDPRYAVLSLDAVTTTFDGPRLALGGGAVGGTLDLGEVVVGWPVTVPLVLANVGDAPLTLSRVHIPSPGLSLAVEASIVDADGSLRPPVAIAPGGLRALTVRFAADAARSPGDSGPVDTGAQAIYLQLFSDDAAAPRLDDGDPASGEHRLRLVYTARSPAAPGRPVALAELPQDRSAPRLWIDEGARFGRGGRIVDLGAVDGAAPGVVTATLRNLGLAPLGLELLPPAAGATLSRPVVPPGGTAELRVALPPAGDDDALGAIGVYRHVVTLITSDPLLPTIDVAFIGARALQLSPAR